MSADELITLRADVRAGRAPLEVRPAVLRLADLMSTPDAASRDFGEHRDAAFAAQRDRWAARA